MRRRQRARLQAAERARDERQEQEAAAELASRTRYTVGFGEPTIADFENAYGLYQAEIIEGTAQMRNVTLKKNGVLTPAGAERYRRLRQEAGIE